MSGSVNGFGGGLKTRYYTQNNSPAESRPDSGRFRVRQEPNIRFNINAIDDSNYFYKTEDRRNKVMSLRNSTNNSFDGMSQSPQSKRVEVKKPAFLTSLSQR